MLSSLDRARPIAVTLTTAIGLHAQSLDPDVVPRSPEAAIASMEMRPGYSLELVAAEPMIEEPAIAVFDGNGRMYVAEMRTYMQDIDGSNAFDPISRISLLEDTDGDGRMDKHTVFADGLVLPRMILTMHEGIVIRETNTLDLWWLKDTDGDGKSDWKKKVFEGGGRGGNLEHQPSGLLWAIDNRCYVTYTGGRYRWDVATETFVRESVAGDGQWGMTQDDEGQLFYSRAGGERPCESFQQNPQYGKLSLPGQFAPGYAECWPIDNIPDVQGGPRRIRDDNTLNHFTACCGQEIYRGDRLPQELYGNYFLPEPVGRLIRRSTVRMESGVRVLDNAYEKTEFIRTTDANFRPINMITAPDGTMYVVDMYRGIIQEGNWVREGSYLRGVVEKYGLDKNIGRGRVYRIRHEDYEPGPRPNMLEQSAAELVAHLDHPNGWWRDEAQKLIVLRNDDSVVPALQKVAHHGQPIARLHALWTLNGMGKLQKPDLLSAMADDDARVRRAAIRMAEAHLDQKGGDEDVRTAVLAAATKDRDADVALQAVRTIAYEKFPGYADVLRQAADLHKDHVGITHTVKEHFAGIARAEAAARKKAEERKRNAAIAASVERGEKHYKMLCFTCHGTDGNGMPVPGTEGMTLAPPLSGSPRAVGDAERTVRIVLNGMQGPVDGKTYPGAMVPLNAYPDEWVADVLTYVRRSFGNDSSPIKPEQVKRIRAASKDRAAMWTQDELRQFDPILKARKRWKLTASARQNQTNRMIDGNRNSQWASGGQQKAGMWIAVELPYAVDFEGLHLRARHGRQMPAAFTVALSEDGKSWRDVATASGDAGTSAPSNVNFAGRGRHVRITLTEPRDGENWTVAELEMFGTHHPRR